MAGGGRPDAVRTRAELALHVVEQQGDAAEVFVTERAGQAYELAKAAIARGTRLVVAWGGDGTINEVASALAFRAVPLAIVPSGSGNGLALELGIDLRPQQALRNALGAEPHAIDVGELGGRLFVNIAGIGIDAHVAAEFNARGNRRRGLFGYARIAAGALVRYVPAGYEITTGGDRIGARAVIVTIANSPQWGNGARIAPGASVDDGALDLVVVQERSRLATLCSLPRLFNGTADRIPGCSVRRIERATIESDRPMVFHVDGEPVAGGTELTARVHPGALQVAVS